MAHKIFFFFFQDLVKIIFCNGRTKHPSVAHRDQGCSKTLKGEDSFSRTGSRPLNRYSIPVKKSAD